MTPPTRRRLSEAQLRRARELAGGADPVVPRLASTVVLIRAAAGGGIEVYVHRRHRGMRFAAGMVAFPGGGVDPVDTTAELADEATWARRLDVADPVVARGFVAAAVRELAEETSIEADAGDLLPWAHWITPTFDEHRYDTWFFVLPLPDGAVARDVSGETDGVDWVRPADEVARADAGVSGLMPPTRAVLTELATYESVDDVVAAAEDRQIVTVVPSWRLDGDHVVITAPGSAQ